MDFFSCFSGLGFISLLSVNLDRPVRCNASWYEMKQKKGRLTKNTHTHTMLYFSVNTFFIILNMAFVVVSVFSSLLEPLLLEWYFILETATILKELQFFLQFVFLSPISVILENDDYSLVTYKWHKNIFLIAKMRQKHKPKKQLIVSILCCFFSFFILIF